MWFLRIVRMIVESIGRVQYEVRLRIALDIAAFVFCPMFQSQHASLDAVMMIILAIDRLQR